MQQRTRTVIGVLVTLLLVVAFVWLQPTKKPTVPSLTRYVPHDASFAFLVHREFVYDDAVSFTSRITQLKDTHEFIQSEWDALESALGMRVNEALWYFRASSNTSGILVTLSRPMTSDEAAAISSKTFQLASINDAGPASTAILTPSTIYIGGAGDAVVLHDELFTDMHTRATLYSHGTVPRAVSELASTLGLEATTTSAFVAHLDTAGPMLRLQIVQSGVTPGSTGMLDVSLPSDVQLIVGGIPSEAQALLYQKEPLGLVMTRFINQLSNAYSIPTENIMQGLSHVAVLALRDDQWILAGRDSEALKEFSSELMAWSTPRIRESTLPDRTIFREYVKNSSEPQTLDLEGMPVLFWGRNSSSTPSQSDAFGIFGVSESDVTFITNNKVFVSSQLKNNIKISDFPQVRTCRQSSLLAGAPISFFANFSEKNDNNSDSQAIISLLGTDKEGKNQVSLFCF